MLHFNSGDVVWTFDTTTMALDIEVDEQIDFSLLSSGTYNYQFVDYSCGDPNTGLELNGTTYGALDQSQIHQNTLTLSSACLDGPILVFTR